MRARDAQAWMPGHDKKQKMGAHVQAIRTLAITAALLAGAVGAQAALVNRGGGMIYDTTLNLTWLADMNYAKTSG